MVLISKLASSGMQFGQLVNIFVSTFIEIRTLFQHTVQFFFSFATSLPMVFHSRKRSKRLFFAFVAPNRNGLEHSEGIPDDDQNLLVSGIRPFIPLDTSNAIMILDTMDIELLFVFERLITGIATDLGILLRFAI